MRSLLLMAAFLAAFLSAWAAVPAAAAEPSYPGRAADPYVRWEYPAQISTGPIESGTDDTHIPAAGGAFLTLPFLGPHYVTSIFDHCSPNYVPDGRVCRYDGTVASAGFGPDPLFGSGYPSIQDGTNYLFYDGHDGIDYGLFYENVAAAGDGVVSFAGWDRPGCERCGFGQFVLLDHGNGITTRYAHLQSIYVLKGVRVRRGQVLGLSGNTGSSSGEHLHFGVYLTTGMVPIDPYGWGGTTSDPWPHDVGNLWQGGSPRFPAVSIPAVKASAEPAADDPTRIDVSWSAVGEGTRFEVRVVKDEKPGRAWLTGVAAGTGSFRGEPGHTYWFLVTSRNPLGWTDLGNSGTVSLTLD